MKKSKSYHILKTIPNNISDDEFISLCKKERIVHIRSWLVLVMVFCGGSWSNLLFFQKMKGSVKILLLLSLVFSTYILIAFLRDMHRLIQEIRMGKNGYALTAMRYQNLTAAGLSKYLEWNNLSIYKLSLNVDSSKSFYNVFTWRIYAENKKTKERAEIKLPPSKRPFSFHIDHDEILGLSGPDGIIDLSGTLSALPMKNQRNEPILFTK